MLVQGRVLEHAEIAPSAAGDSAWKNLVNIYKRIDAAPVPHAQVRVRVGSVDQHVLADDEGFFRQWIDLPTPLASAESWHRAEVQLVAPLRPDQLDVRANGVVRVPSTLASFGVISDLDDTVIQSRVSNFMQAIRTVMLGNARTRLPFPGVAAFYQALERGGDAARQNPIFDVSSSPWNIHDVIAEFMDIQRIPMGPICLRDWDFDLNALTSHRLRSHKEPLICEILDLYPIAAVHPDRRLGTEGSGDLPRDHRSLSGADSRDLYPERASRSGAARGDPRARAGRARRGLVAHPRRRHVRGGGARGGAWMDHARVTRRDS